MELIIKASAAALMAVVASLLLKRTNPEISILLSIITVTVIMFSALGLTDGFKELRNTVKTISGSSEIYIAPIMKCLGVSLITKLSSDLCKDSSQNAAAFAVEMTGTVCALTIVMPLLMNVLKILGGLA